MPTCSLHTLSLSTNLGPQRMIVSVSLNTYSYLSFRSNVTFSYMTRYWIKTALLRSGAETTSLN